MFVIAKGSSGALIPGLVTFITIVVVFIRWSVYQELQSLKQQKKIKKKYEKMDFDKNYYDCVMLPFFEQGLVREVCSSKNLSIVCIGEIDYFACPHKNWGDGGIWALRPTKYQLCEILRDNAEFIILLSDYRNNLKMNPFIFSHLNINDWKQWIDENKFNSNVDKDFENRLNQICEEVNEKKTRTLKEKFFGTGER